MKKYIIVLGIILFILVIVFAVLLISANKNNISSKNTNEKNIIRKEFEIKEVMSETEEPILIISKPKEQEIIKQEEEKNKEEEKEDKTKSEEKNQEQTKKVEETKKEKYKYYIKVNYIANTVTIYVKDEAGNYTIPYKAMICSTGTATPRSGVYGTTNKYTWRKLNGGVYGQYATRIVNSILFHSVPYLNSDKGSLKYWEYDKLGTAASEGCVRLTVQDAKWIYDNCEKGTKVEFYGDNNPGPLGKPTAQKISSYEEVRNWDPTDPSSKNPWKTFEDKSEEKTGNVEIIEKNENTVINKNEEVNNKVNEEQNNNVEEEIKDKLNQEQENNVEEETKDKVDEEPKDNTEDKENSSNEDTLVENNNEEIKIESEEKIS